MFNDQLEIKGDAIEEVEGFDNLQTEEEIAEYEAWLDENETWAEENGIESALNNYSDDGQALESVYGPND